MSKEYGLGDTVDVKGQKSNVNASRRARGTVLKVNADGTYDVTAGVQGRGSVVLANMNRSSLILVEKAKEQKIAIIKSFWIDTPLRRGFCNFPGTYLCRVGSNSAYGNYQGGFVTEGHALKFLTDNGLSADDWKVTTIR